MPLPLRPQNLGNCSAFSALPLATLSQDQQGPPPVLCLSMGMGVTSKTTKQSQRLPDRLGDGSLCHDLQETPDNDLLHKI
jgi:hypothetical protein